MTCSYSVHKWCWNWVHGCEPDQHVELVSLRWRFFFYTLCIDMFVPFSEQDITYSGDCYWKGLATHLNNLCYGMQRSMYSSCRVYKPSWKHSKHWRLQLSLLQLLFSCTPSTFTRTWSLLEKAIFQSVSTNCMVGYGVSASNCEKKRKC